VTDTIRIEHLQQWIGKSQTATDTVTAAPATALHATLDHPEQTIQLGHLISELWHWLYFLPTDRQSNIDASGHAKLGGFMPPVPLPRRMWAGSQLDFHHAIRVGDIIERTSTIDNVTQKTGKSGELVFVRVKHQIDLVEQPNQLLQVMPSSQSNEPTHTGITLLDPQRLKAITEYHDIVYRAPALTNAPLPVSTKAPQSADWERKIETNDVLLFRYSALTFNGHRIHYDRRYVTDVEGYPGLIVHGPLIATLLLDALKQELQEITVIHYEFKAIKPIFDTHPFYVCGAISTDETTIASSPSNASTVHLWAKDFLGDVAMQATAIVGTKTSDRNKS